jgi:hypothetical protein
MNPLDHLSSLLSAATQEAAKPMSASSGIDQLLRDMQKRSKGRPGGQLSEDHQLDAVRKFWGSQEVKTFRDAYLLSWSLGLPHQAKGPCILEDRHRLQRVLDGVDGWRGRPGAYRRCYQGLVRSYFSYDALLDTAPPHARNNWKLLREYLYDRNTTIGGGALQPAWVDAAQGNRTVFSDTPCKPYVDALLRGETSAVDELCEDLGINKASWFLRELVMAQVEGATQLGDRQFKELLPSLLKMLAANAVLRDRGMVKVLDRYADVDATPMNLLMRDQAVAWWGNPWLESNATRWGGVKQEARSMVADWLKLEFIETFFTKLAEDGLADPRRMNFWKRYVKSIGHIEFALGSTARNSTERDFVSLRRKMDGLICDLDASGANNAFIMHMGPLVAVEFSDLGNAFYGYDSNAVPFDTDKMLGLTVNGTNTLKNKRRQILWMGHSASHGYAKWEDLFEATLKQNFGLEPMKVPAAAARSAVRRIAAPPPPVPSYFPPVAAPTASNVRPPAPRPAVQDPRPEPPAVGQSDPGSAAYSRAALDAFVQRHGLEIRDMTNLGGNLWVVADDKNFKVHAALMRWGFKNKPGKGWWK